MKYQPCRGRIAPPYILVIVALWEHLFDNFLVSVFLAGYVSGLTLIHISVSKESCHIATQRSFCTIMEFY